MNKRNYKRVHTWTPLWANLRGLICGCVSKLPEAFPRGEDCWLIVCPASTGPVLVPLKAAAVAAAAARLFGGKCDRGRAETPAIGPGRLFRLAALDDEFVECSPEAAELSAPAKGWLDPAKLTAAASTAAEDALATPEGSGLFEKFCAECEYRRFAAADKADLSEVSCWLLPELFPLPNGGANGGRRSMIVLPTTLLFFTSRPLALLRCGLWNFRSSSNILPGFLRLDVRPLSPSISELDGEEYESQLLDCDDRCEADRISLRLDGEGLIVEGKQGFLRTGEYWVHDRVSARKGLLVSDDPAWGLYRRCPRWARFLCPGLSMPTGEQHRSVSSSSSSRRSSEPGCVELLRGFFPFEVNASVRPALFGIVRFVPPGSGTLGEIWFVVLLGRPRPRIGL